MDGTAFFLGLVHLWLKTAINFKNLFYLFYTSVYTDREDCAV